MRREGDGEDARNVGKVKRDKKSGDVDMRLLLSSTSIRRCPVAFPNYYKANLVAITPLVAPGTFFVKRSGCQCVTTKLVEHVEHSVANW